MIYLAAFFLALAATFCALWLQARASNDAGLDALIASEAELKDVKAQRLALQIELAIATAHLEILRRAMTASSEQIAGAIRLEDLDPEAGQDSGDEQPGAQEPSGDPADDSMLHDNRLKQLGYRGYRRNG